MAKQTALHYQHGRDAKRYTVLKKTAKTADLGLEDGTLVIGGCAIGKPVESHRSYCLIEEDGAKPPTKAELKKTAADLRTKAEATKAAAALAMQAAEAGKESDNAEALITEALAADEAAKAAVQAAEEAEAAAK